MGKYRKYIVDSRGECLNTCPYGFIVDRFPHIEPHIRIGSISCKLECGACMHFSTENTIVICTGYQDLKHMWE